MSDIRYEFIMSQIKHIRDIKETEKTKISLVYYEGCQGPCMLKVCKNRDLTEVYKALMEIRHPNVAIVYDCIYENGNTYVLEEYIIGKTLADILGEKGTFSEDETSEIMIELCKGLDVLHRHEPPIIHNDIKTSNIMIKEDGSVKLFDFDISRIYKEDSYKNTKLMGTYEYAAPEHYGFGQSDPRTDIYSLGVTMHEMLTGVGLDQEHNVTYQGSLDKILRRCVEIDRKKRYASATLLKLQLEKYRKADSRMLGIVLACTCGLVILAAGGMLLNDHFKNVTGSQEAGAVGNYSEDDSQEVGLGTEIGFEKEGTETEDIPSEKEEGTETEDTPSEKEEGTETEDIPSEREEGIETEGNTSEKEDGGETKDVIITSGNLTYANELDWNNSAEHIYVFASSDETATPRSICGVNVLKRFYGLVLEYDEAKGTWEVVQTDMVLDDVNEVESATLGNGRMIIIFHYLSSEYGQEDSYNFLINNVVVGAEFYLAGDITELQSASGSITGVYLSLDPVEEETSDSEPEQDDESLPGKLTYANGIDLNNITSHIYVFASADETATLYSFTGLGIGRFEWWHGIVLEYDETKGVWKVVVADFVADGINEVETVTLGDGRMVIMFYASAEEGMEDGYNFFVNNAVVGTEFILTGDITTLQSTSGSLTGVALSLASVDEDS